MHAVTQSLAHRAQAPATRARARCPPHYYHPASLARSTPSSPAYLTPASASSASIPTPSIKQHVPPSLAHPHAGSSTPIPNATAPPQRNRFASALVDLTVKALCDIWPVPIIPFVFVPTPHLRARSEHVAGPFAPPVPGHPPTPTQLPSPPNSPGESSHGAFDNDDDATTAATMRGFVIEVLRRSRTSTSVLQTALCYLEAIQPKVSELAALEREGAGIRGEEDQAARLVLASDPAACEPEADIDDVLDPSSYDADADTGRASTGAIVASQLDTTPIDIPPAMPSLLCQPGQPGKKPRTDPATLSPLPPLPSPLLDPRRAFIAALILASKFAQDKCYSNRAWAKLAGLPPREIGRCERALGDALCWRLWVGKKSAQQSMRPLGRAKTEGSLSMDSNAIKTSADGPERGLRRSGTLPAAAFRPPPTVVPAPYLQPTATLDLVPFAATMQGPWMPVMQQSPMNGPWLEPTPQLSASPATTDSSVDEQRTVQLFDLHDMPNLGVVEAKGAPTLPLQSSVGSFGSEGGIVALGWEMARPWATAREWAWGVPAC